MASRIRAPGERVTEAGAVVDVRGCVRSPRHRNVGADVERVGLVMIEGEERGGKSKIRQAARDWQFAIGDLIGVCQVDLSTVGDAGRAECQFPTADFSSINRDRQTQPRSDAALVKEIAGAGFEIVRVENPTAIGNGDSELMLFVALSVKRQETTIVRGAKLL